MALSNRYRTARITVTGLMSWSLAVMLPEGSFAQPARQPSSTVGEAIGQRLCVSCHLIEGAPSQTVPAGIPPFRSIANRPGQTGQQILDTLVQPRHPMPDMQLSMPEIADLIAYIETLRTDPSIPPLVSPNLPPSTPR